MDAALSNHQPLVKKNLITKMSPLVSMRDLKDKILQLVDAKGPLLPAAVSKEFNVDSIIAGAYLSELADNKKIVLSFLKVGGSPLYLTEAQRPRLQDYKDKLDEKDQEAFDILKSEKVVRDIDLDPLLRVAMRSIKDFAIPLKVNKSEVFWKWFLTSGEDALSIIKQKLTASPPKPEFQVDIKKSKEESPAAKPAAPKIELKPQTVPKPELKVEQKQEQKTEVPPQKLTREEKQERKKMDELLKWEKDLEKKELDLLEKIKDEKDKIDQLKRKQKELDEEWVDRERKLTDKFGKEREKIQQAFKQREEELMRKLEEQQKLGEALPAPIEEKDEFLEKIKSFCEKKGIIIDAMDVTRKNKEVEMIVSVPTPVGSVRYFCIAKDKKRCNDGDLSSAYLRGQSKALPTLFLSTGDITKRAEEMLGNEFRQMVIWNVDENGSSDNRPADTETAQA
jgi:hypothetical protein